MGKIDKKLKDDVAEHTKIQLEVKYLIIKAAHVQCTYTTPLCMYSKLYLRKIYM